MLFKPEGTAFESQHEPSNRQILSKIKPVVSCLGENVKSILNLADPVQRPVRLPRPARTGVKAEGKALCRSMVLRWSPASERLSCERFLGLLRRQVVIDVKHLLARLLRCCVL
ncbi:hypothetical protein EVAR_48097_1 [Eumeta japonica]|uniref:Uncharacterized protein n=1 Tax=Eumeta variegata TaxID=151549 RepID=A0A4C1XNQ0_EUMVA|nr:hypothetical protein EVAR_48097_1 [Eumeta japonica]